MRGALGGVSITIEWIARIEPKIPSVVAPPDLQGVVRPCVHPHTNHTAVRINHRASISRAKVKILQVIKCRCGHDHPAFVPIVRGAIMSLEHIAG